MFKRYPYRLLYQTKANFKLQLGFIRHARVNPSRVKQAKDTKAIVELPQDLRPTINTVPLHKSILRAKSLAEILKLWTEELESSRTNTMPDRDVACFFFFLGKKGLDLKSTVDRAKKSRAFGSLVEEVERRIPTFDFFHLSQLLRSANWLRFRSDSFISQVVAAMITKIPTGKDSDIANSLIALSSLGVKDDLLIKALGRKVAADADTFQAQNLVNTFCHFTRLRDISHDEVTSIFQGPLIKNCKSFNVIDCSGVLNSMAKIEYRDFFLFEAIATQMAARLSSCEEKFSPQSLATAWNAMAKLDFRSKKLEDVLTKVCRSWDFTEPVEISLILNAMVKLNVPDARKMLPNLSQKVRKHLPKFSLLDLCQTVHSIGQFEYYEHGLFEQMDEAAQKLIPNMELKELSMVLQGFVKARFKPASLDSYLDGVEKLVETSRFPPTYYYLSIMHFLWEFRVDRPKLAAACLDGYISVLDGDGENQHQKTPRALCGALLYMSSLGLHRPEFINKAHSILKNRGLEALSDHHLSQLRQHLLTLQLEYPEFSTQRDLLTLDSLPESDVREVTVSRFQQHVTNVLKKHMKIPITQEVIAMGVYMVDIMIIAIDSKGDTVKIAVEANGPMHYFQGTTDERGRSASRTKHLEAYGYRVVNVMYFEWNHFESQNERINYLTKKLADADIDISQFKKLSTNL